LLRRRGGDVDNLTHTFTALALVHVVSRERPSGRVLVAAAVAANVQDIDSLSRSAIAYHQVHRGITHSLLAMPLIALLVAAVFHVFRRHSDNPGGASPGWWALFGICLLAAASHLLLDALNAYGLRPFLPFDATWYYGDLAGIIDPWMWLVLGGTALLLTGKHLGAIRTWVVVGSVIVFVALRIIPLEGTFGAIAGLVWVAGAAMFLVLWLRGVGVEHRRFIAGAGLAATIAYLGCLVLLHRSALLRAHAIAETAVAGGRQLDRVVAIPKIGDLSTWRGLAVTEDAIYRFAISIGAAPPPQIERFATLRTLPLDERQHLEADPEARAYLSFARFVAVAVEAKNGRRVVLVADPRYDAARPGEPDTWSVQSILPQ